MAGAVLHDSDAAAARAVEMVLSGEVIALSGKRISAAIASICVHGDTPGAVAMARGGARGADAGWPQPPRVRFGVTAPRYLPAGESALVVEFGATADPVLHDRVMALDAALAAAPIAGIAETVPTYRSLMIHFDPRVLTSEALAQALRSLAPGAAPRRQAKRWRVPACYDAPHAEDLAELADLVGLPPEKVADLHAGAYYKVVMYGFAPGFVFLAGLPSELAVSRRQTPRPPAKPGALTVANGQALIASIAMPTGWYVLGRTPARTFDVGRDPAFPIAVGDHVRFERVDADAFEALDAEAAAGRDLLVADMT